MKLLLTILVLCVFSSFAVAQSNTEYPRMAIVNNVQENHSITYDCHKNNDTLDCSFVQISVRKKSKPADLDAQLAKVDSEYPKERDQLKKEECKSIHNMAVTMNDMVEGKKTLDQIASENPQLTDKKLFLSKAGKYTEVEKKDALELMKSLDEFCSNKTKESYIKVIRAGYNKDSKTCLVSSNSFKQIFTWVSDGRGDLGTWVVKSKPEGPCGIVQLSRFEPDKTSSGIVFWNYIAKKAITNPNGKILNSSCSMFDETQYDYVWNETSPKQLDCSYMQYSPF